MDFDTLFATVATIVRKGSILGAKFSAGAYTPAVPASHGWCVLDLQGAPIALTHDAYEAAVIFLRAEAEPELYTSQGAPPWRAKRDEEVARERYEERMERFGLLSWCAGCQSYVRAADGCRHTQRPRRSRHA